MEKSDNELIAEFMGVAPENQYLVTHYRYDKHFHGWISQSSYDDVKDLNTTGLEATRVKQNPYHTSWDWLMPVVKRIHELNSVGIAMYYDIEKQYEVVISFIKFYNTQNISQS